MKIIVLSDTHMGVRNNNPHFIEYQLARWKDLFQYAKHFGIKSIIHGGDFFDNRSSISLAVLDATRRFNALRADWDGTFDLLVGNHDVAFKNDNTLNSPDLLLENIEVHWSKPVTKTYGGVKIDLIPWINNGNFAEVKEFVKESVSPVCIGHFEINGAPFHKGGILCDGGIDAEMFSGYNRVLSGHFHTRSKVGRVEYIGAGFDYTWADWDDPRGFVVLDTETQEIEYVNWKTFMFVMGELQEDGTVSFVPELGTAGIKGKYVRLACAVDSNPIIEETLRKLDAEEPAELQVFFSAVKDVNNTLVDLEEIADETKVIRQVVEESIADEELRQEVNVYLEHLYREATAQ